MINYNTVMRSPGKYEVDLTMGGDTYGHLTLDWVDGQEPAAMFHIDLTMWSPSICKEIVNDFASIRLFLEDRGVMHMLGINKCSTIEEQDKWVKFCNLFGFEHVLDKDGHTCVYRPVS